jgi:hypothetical protein
MKRIALILLVGLALGVGAGLYFGLVIAPVKLTDVAPAVLPEAEQVAYVHLIAAAYWRDDNLATARQRLASLARADLADWLRRTAVEAILQEQDELQIRQLVYLATSIGLDSPAFAPYLPAKPLEEVSDDAP